MQWLVKCVQPTVTEVQALSTSYHRCGASVDLKHPTPSASVMQLLNRTSNPKWIQKKNKKCLVQDNGAGLGPLFGQILRRVEVANAAITYQAEEDSLQLQQMGSLQYDRQ